MLFMYQGRKAVRRVTCSLVYTNKIYVNKLIYRFLITISKPDEIW